MRGYGERSPLLARRGGRDQRNIAKHRVELTGAEREPGRAKHQEWLFRRQPNLDTKNSLVEWNHHPALRAPLLARRGDFEPEFH